MRISWTPGPTLGIGFQSFGSRPHCQTPPGRSPDSSSGECPRYTKTWMPRQSPAAASLRYGRHPKASETPPPHAPPPRSEEHTSELQSRPHLVCRLLLEKKNSKMPTPT